MSISVLNSGPFLSSSRSHPHKHGAPKAEPEPEDHVLRLLGALPNLQSSVPVSLHEVRSSPAAAAGSARVPKTSPVLETRAQRQVSGE